MEIGAAGETWDEVESELELAKGSLRRRSRSITVTPPKAGPAVSQGEWLKPLDKPPFVALDCRVDHCFYSSFTLGGLDTLPTGQVVDEDRSVAGLYAAGRTACGLPRWGEGYSSGMSLADATFFGRQAGARPQEPEPQVDRAQARSVRRREAIARLASFVNSRDKAANVAPATNVAAGFTRSRAVPPGRWRPSVARPSAG